VPTPIADPVPAAEPAPVADPAPAPSGGSVEDAIATYFGDVYDQAIGVARCESGLDPNAVSPGGGNWGLFQINAVHRQRVADMGYSWDQILDPYVNAAVARSIYDDAGGWGPWGCRGAAY
jgi:soluble lytic murein transglycosylase-like protein